MQSFKSLICSLMVFLVVVHVEMVRSDRSDDGETYIYECYGKDACKDKSIRCNQQYFDGYMVECDGESACSGNTMIDAGDAVYLKVTCDGKDACKGNTRIYCPEGLCLLECWGEKACEDIRVYEQENTQFSCTGNCDDV
mmetsp:Transcript_3435/g.5790  ORF Transcript_3435/g.5790 Transcript_3435/m.5790 type:complete len:139 (+) Transcript_3435:76-492(+)